MSVFSIVTHLLAFVAGGVVYHFAAGFTIERKGRSAK